MKTKKLSMLVMTMILVLSCSCTTKKEQNSADPGNSLKAALDGKFYMGVAMNEAQIMGRDTSSLRVIEQHFNSAVAENVMKSGPIHPEEGKYEFEVPDKFIEYTQEHDMYTVGHCLVWHSQAPPWFFTDEQGNDVSREVLIERMRSHIETVAGRYKGKVDAWDVVNEAFNDDGSWRETKFYEIIGEDYFKLAFRIAHEVDPEAELLYNDYSMFNKGRREAVIRVVKEMQTEGVPIHGIGMQAHYGMGFPSIEAFEESIVAFSETGLPVHITEFDIDVLPGRRSIQGAEISEKEAYEEMLNPFKGGLPDSVSIALNERWMDFFDVLLKHHDKIKRVTMWGLADHHSWKNGWPIRGRTNYPLLFDRNYDPKPVVEEIIKKANEL
jgi:endo-1,4-beta-xylanase